MLKKGDGEKTKVNKDKLTRMLVVIWANKKIM